MNKRVLSALLLFAALATTLRGDSLLFKDGRYYEVPRILPLGDRFEVLYEHGKVVVPAEFVEQCFVLQDSGEYQPRNAEEEEKLSRGLVPYEGRWVSRAKRDKEIADRNRRRQEAMDEQRAHQLWRNRYQESTKHFDFEYTVPEAVANEYMEMFEAYFEVFSKEWGVRQSSKDGRLKVCFYNDEDDFHRIGNASRGVLGYYRFVEPKELNFFYERRDERLTLDVLYHETNHYLFDLLTEENFAFPAWLNEGMGEYYGASRWDPERKSMSIGHVQEGRLINLIDAMDGNEFQDLRELLGTPRIDALQYAWSWALCHMLMQDSKTAKRFQDYIKKIARDKKLHRVRYPANPAFEWPPPEEALEQFQKTLKIEDLDAFQTAWYQYIRGFEVSTARGYHEAALFCMQWNRPVRATLYFQKAIELGSDNPETYENAGKVLRQREKLDEAIQVLEKGIELDPLNSYLYLELGRTLSLMPSEADRTRGGQLKKLAREMDPSNLRILWWTEE